MKKVVLFFLASFILTNLSAQEDFVPSKNKFRQLRNDLATPNVYRNAAGAPGHEYWQQRADYKIGIELDDEKQQIHGSETVTYYNNSPDELSYLWVQLDQNQQQKNSLTSKSSPSSMRERIPASSLNRIERSFEGGFNLLEVKDAKGVPLAHTINYTMMRIDLPQPLKPGKTFKFSVKWWYNINDRMKDGGGRSGMEYFEDDDNYVYTIAQFYPRMAVYNEVEGWQNKQFLGRSEFALTFGNYDVKITVPEDHVVGATGVLMNESEVLTAEEINNLKKAGKSYDKPVIIVSEDEAIEAMKSKKKGLKTWSFHAENVRDFAFSSSRRFIWDAMAVKIGDKFSMAMSLYPPEGNPLWEKYSTRVVAHTLKVYSKHTFDYPYPVAYSVHTKWIGMEYPMMAFNGGRPESDGTYSERTKWSMIGVVIHEVGHNFFPMIVNSDERQWTWMDEGLNTFLQGLAEREWDHNHPSPTGRPADIVNYMSGDQSNIAPIMINGDLTMQFNANAYRKPATGLIILRETIMGRALFDFAFKQYAQRWKFKHPTPDDFFRTMEDASAVDLDWYWRGWFYGIDRVDISIEDVDVYSIKSGNPVDEKNFSIIAAEEESEELTVQRNRKAFKSVVEKDETMRDFYDSYDENVVTPDDQEHFEKYLSNLDQKELEFINAKKYYVQIDFKNIGGMVMPLIVQLNFKDGTSEIQRVPAEIWSRDNVDTRKVFIIDKELASVMLDPFLETADCDMGNNNWPRKVSQSRFELYKYGNRGRSSANPMQNQ